MGNGSKEAAGREIQCLTKINYYTTGVRIRPGEGKSSQAQAGMTGQGPRGTDPQLWAGLKWGPCTVGKDVRGNV